MRKTLKACYLENDAEVLSVEFCAAPGGIPKYVMPDGTTPIDAVVVMARRTTAKRRATIRAALVQAVELLDRVDEQRKSPFKAGRARGE